MSDWRCCGGCARERRRRVVVFAAASSGRARGGGRGWPRLELCGGVDGEAGGGCRCACFGDCYSWFCGRRVCRGTASASSRRVLWCAGARVGRGRRLRCRDSRLARPPRQRVHVLLPCCLELERRCAGGVWSGGGGNGSECLRGTTGVASRGRGRGGQVTRYCVACSPI